MLNIAICDDLTSDRMHLEKLTESFCNEEDFDTNIIKFESGETLLRYFVNKKAEFDIVFLDIYMNGISGLKSAEVIRRYGSDCKIIFTTTSSDHSLESFKVFPFNYLVKPITKAVFNPVLKKAVKEINKEKQKSLTIKTSDNIRTIFYKELIFIESKAKIVNIYTTDNNILPYKSKLDEIQNELDDPRFLRCHKSFLVNMDFVSRMADFSFLLNTGKQIPITQRNFAGMKRIFYDYILNKADLK